MVPRTSLSAPLSQGKASPMKLYSPPKKELSGGTPTVTGHVPQSMAPLSSCPNAEAPIHFPSPMPSMSSYLVYIYFLEKIAEFIYAFLPILHFDCAAAEWFNGDVKEIIDNATATGADPTVSDAYAINGQPGFPNNCSNGN
jgi:hypothetical protein